MLKGKDNATHFAFEFKILSSYSSFHRYIEITDKYFMTLAMQGMPTKLQKIDDNRKLVSAECNMSGSLID